LELSSNQLTELPEFISNLKSLMKLNLSKNKLENIPEFIGSLKNLEDLVWCDGQLTIIPESLSNLQNLKGLMLYENQLTEIPESLGNLKNLMLLGLTNNQLKKIPESFTNLKNLKKLWLDECVRIPENVLTIPNLKIIKDPLTTSLIKTNMKTYQQKILFGSPGTGKSYQIDKHIIPYELLIDVEKMPANVIKTVFHPEYTYGDFVGKLMPITVGDSVKYRFYEGHFLKALSQAYKNIIAAQDNDGVCEKVALVIDEINRGNSAAIFGTIFQLLDREPDGWSSYEVSVNEIIFNRLLDLCDLTEHANVKGKAKKVTSYLFGEEEIKTETLQKRLNCHFENRTIKIPPNLSILASMNTSDSSIYYMDSAFKRRWEWEFIDVDPEKNKPVEGVAFKTPDEWNAFVKKLNDFIKSNHKSIRGIEDKQIGQRFINFETEGEISNSSIRNKLMFFLWDSVFNRDKKPLVTLLFGDDKESELITFGDFATQVDKFIDKINEH
jgi:5-methylcytosine-specific restriction protein B